MDLDKNKEYYRVCLTKYRLKSQSTRPSNHSTNKLLFRSLRELTVWLCYRNKYEEQQTRLRRQFTSRYRRVDRIPCILDWVHVKNRQVWYKPAHRFQWNLAKIKDTASKPAWTFRTFLFKLFRPPPPPQKKSFWGQNPPKWNKIGLKIWNTSWELRRTTNSPT